MKLKLLLCLSLIMTAIANLHGQTASISKAGNSNPSVKWTVNTPFEQKVFIENKGQYASQNSVLPKEILFGARQGGLQYYFTRHSVLIKRDVSIKRTETE